MLPGQHVLLRQSAERITGPLQEKRTPGTGYVDWRLDQLELAAVASL